MSKSINQTRKAPHTSKSECLLEKQASSEPKPKKLELNTNYRAIETWDT